MTIKFLILAETRTIADSIANGSDPLAWELPDEFVCRSYGDAIAGHRFDRVFLALPSDRWVESSGDALRFVHFLRHARTFVKPDGEFIIL